MPGPAWEDLGVFLQPGDFAVEAELRFAGDRLPSARVSILFDEAFLDPDLGEYGTEAVAPRIQGRAADLASLARGDTVVIAGRSFDALSGVEPDGTGWGSVSLSDAAIRY